MAEYRIISRGAFQFNGLPARAKSMLGLKTLFGALMLVLMVWTGGLAHAAEQIECIPVTSEAAGHFEGDGDQLPSDPDQSVAHHHAGCSGHQVAAASGSPALSFAPSARTAPHAWREAGAPGREPDTHLRPPIA